METNNRDLTRHKKPYVKPELKRVMLRPEEAVLGGCKTSTSSGSLQPKCSAPCCCSSLAS
jgi:hypothetical protein